MHTVALIDALKRALKGRGITYPRSRRDSA